MFRWMQVTAALGIAAAASLGIAATLTADENVQVVQVRDDCDPATFNAGPPDGPGLGHICDGNGGTTFGAFIAELQATQVAEKWRFNPDRMSEPKPILAHNRGGVRDYLREVVEVARRTGYTETMLGRRRYLPDLTSDNRQRREMAERMALNAPIQGSAADVIKVAMLNVEKAIEAEGLRSRMLLQVHDELVLEVAPGEREALETLVRREMAGAAQLSVPLEVSVGFGASWDAAAH